MALRLKHVLTVPGVRSEDEELCHIIRGEARDVVNDAVPITVAYGADDNRLCSSQRSSQK